jgi:uncharacterized protein (TIGR02246 family)
MEAEIRRMLARVADAFRRRDARAVAERYHSNARHTRPSGGVAVGRAAIAEMLPAIFEMLPPDIETEVVSQNVDLITSDLAIVDQRVRNVRRTLTGQRKAVRRRFHGCRGQGRP